MTDQLKQFSAQDTKFIDDMLNYHVVSQKLEQRYSDEDEQDRMPLYAFYIEKGQDREGTVWELTICNEWFDTIVQTYTYTRKEDADHDGELLSELLDINEG